MSAPPDPALAIAQSHALLRRVAAGDLEPGIRLYRPAPTAAFGRLDLRAPGFAQAAHAARRHALTPVLRLVGGRVAVYTNQALIVELFTRVSPDARPDVDARFDDLTATLMRALGALGLDARAGQLPGEYCPGTHSINLAGAVKVAGVGQRVIRGAAVASAVITVGDGRALRSALVDIQASLGVSWEPGTAGSITEHAPEITVDAVEQALRAAAPECRTVTLDADTQALANGVLAHHDLADQRDGTPTTPPTGVSV